MLSEPTLIRRRAVRSALLLALRGSLVRVLAFVGTLVLVRLVTPEEFGLLSIALAITVAAGVLADGGLGASLIRGHEPAIEDIRAVMGFQLTVILLLFLVALPVCAACGTVGGVTALALLSMPINSFRVPSYILLERDLKFGRTVAAELSETVVYYAWSIGAVLAGFGIWGMTTAVVARALVGTVMLIAVSPVRVLRPTFSWARVRPIFAFGAYFQGAALLNVARWQGRDIGIGVIAGAHVLGIWSLAFRLLQVPVLLFESLWRVSYPALSRLREAGVDVRSTLERSMALGAVGGGAITAAIIGGAPSAIPLLFGDTWAGSANLLVLAGLGIVLSSPVSVVAIGYLYSVGRARAVFRVSLIFVTVGLLVTFAGLPLIGTAAIGAGWLAQALVGVILLGREVRLSVQVRIFRAVFPADLAAVAGGSAGWAVASTGSPTAWKAAVGMLLPLLFMAFTCSVFDRDALSSLRRQFGRAAPAATS